MRVEVKAMKEADQRVATAVHEFQGRFASDSHPNERWFAHLELVSATQDRQEMRIVMRDPGDGSLHGWRWRGGTPRSLVWLLDPDLVTGLPAAPDENGVRWWQTQGYWEREITLPAEARDEQTVLRVIASQPRCAPALVTEHVGHEALSRAIAAGLVADEGGLVLTGAGEHRLRYVDAA